MKKVVRIHKQQSPTIIIPKAMCQVLGVTYGDEVCLDLDSYNKIIRITNAKKLEEDVNDFIE
jgi:antitoxin component of MazEF toxin-antitoxin module